MILRRKIFEQLKTQSNEKKISLLLGARQVGKTTLLKELYNELSKTNKCLFLDIDIISNYEKVSTFENLINTLKLNGYQEKQSSFFYLFLDEFQKQPPLTNIIKNVYDGFNNVKIYASGSSSLMIKNQIQESLSGRKKVNELYSLDFEEFIWAKEDVKLTEKLSNAKKLKGEALHKIVNGLHDLLNEFLVFGGYPEVILKQKKEEKIAVLESIFDLYVKKDLVDYLKVDKILRVKKLIEFLAVNNGQKIKYDDVSSIIDLSYPEIKNYLEILEETYIISIIRPFYTNKNKELIKIPKIYFIDNGVRNYFVNNFNALTIRNDTGFLFEGFVISEFIKLGFNELKFWQDKYNNEVDVILENHSLKDIVPIEIKFKRTLKSEDFIGLENFLKYYKKIKKAYLINLSMQKTNKKINSLLPYSLDKIKS